MFTTRPHLFALVALGAAAVLAVMGWLMLAGDAQRPSPTAAATATAAPAVQTGVPRHGDCGIHRDGTVAPALCRDPAADVEVARVHLGGDPGQRCPLFRPDAVLVTTITGDLYACWVPRGGGPKRSFEGAAPAITASPVLLVPVGSCGLIHDDHVHHPRECADPTANAVAEAVIDAGEPGSCPAGTAREETLPDGSRVCWSAT